MNPLYHGTTLKRALRIIKDGFVKGSVPTYTGTGVNLTSTMSTAYSYGSYEDQGVVLKVTLKGDSAIAALEDSSLSDQYFLDNPTIDAATVCGGHILIVWNMDAIVNVEILTHNYSVNVLLEEMANDGENMGYNGWPQHYHNYFFDEAPHELSRKTIQIIKPIKQRLWNNINKRTWLHLPA